MRLRMFTILSVGALVAGGFLGSAPVGAAHRPSASGRGHVAQLVDDNVQTVLYNQNNNDSTVGVVSQNFEASNDAFDAQSADDFIVPVGQIWTVKTILVTGVYFNGSGPAASENVTIYHDNAGVPGTVAAAVTKVGLDSAGSFIIKTGSIALNAGHYWLSVQANMDFSTGGEWGWESRTKQHKVVAQWQNPNGGFGTGCTTWGPLPTCVPSGGPDLMFKLKGVISS
jgi:hypothetical protein